MLLKNLTIKNFKKIEQMELTFQKGFNLVIGDNSIGKTSVLEAISVELGSFLTGIDNVSTLHFSKDEIRRVSNYIGDGSYNMEYKTPVVVEGDIIIDQETFHVKRQKTSYKSSRSTIEPRTICRKAAEMSHDQNAILPILSYQSAARMWSQKKEKWNDPFQDNFSRVVGYTDCLDESSNTKMLTNWCKKMEQVSWQLDKKIQEYEGAKKTTARFIRFITDCSKAAFFYDKRSDELMCQIDSEILPLRLLSAGYRSMIGMVLDIACRGAVKQIL